MSLVYRLGNFFLLIGAALLLLFFVSDAAQVPNYWLFIIGLLSTIIGIYLMRKSPLPPVNAGRFRLLRKKK